MNAISQIEVVKHHRGSLLLEFVVVPDWWNVELIKHGWNVLAGGCIMMYPLKSHRSAVVEIRCDTSFVQKVGFLEGRERCGAGVALYLPSTWEPMWSCWNIFFTTWLLDSLFLYIAASNCSVNIAKSMSERGDTVVGLSLERSGPDHKQLKLSNGQRSHGTKYAKIVRMNIQVNSYLHPLEPNPPLLDTVFQKNIPSLTILESTFQVFLQFPNENTTADCGAWKALEEAVELQKYLQSLGATGLWSDSYIWSPFFSVVQFWAAPKFQEFNKIQFKGLSGFDSKKMFHSGEILTPRYHRDWIPWCHVDPSGQKNHLGFLKMVTIRTFYWIKILLGKSSVRWGNLMMGKSTS